MRPGVGSYTFGWATGTYGRNVNRDQPLMTANELIEAAASLQVEVAQICVLPDIAAMEGIMVKRLHETAQAKRITVELGTMGTDLGVLRAWLRVARILNASIVRTLIVEPSDNLRLERFALERVLPEFEADGVKIAIENHERVSSYALQELIRDISSSSLGICLDSVNSLGRGEGIREVTDLLAPYVFSLHLKDFCSIRGETDMGFRVEGTALGLGALDFHYMLDRVYEWNPGISVILEQWTELGMSVKESTDLQWEWALKGVEVMKEAIRAVEKRAASR